MTTEAREKINTDLESLEFQKNFNEGLTKFNNYQILLPKIRQISPDNQANDWVNDSHYAGCHIVIVMQNVTMLNVIALFLRGGMVCRFQFHSHSD